MTTAEVNGGSKVDLDRSDRQYDDYEPTAKEGGLDVVASQEAADVEIGDRVSGFHVCCAPEPSGVRAAIKLLACMVAGVVFGWSMEKSRVFEPESIRKQMVFQRWIMLKMFLTAIASGQLIMSLLSVLPSTRRLFTDALEGFKCALSNSGLLTSILGPFILGIGMTLSGACPGMILIQLGAGCKNSYYTLIGTLIGALLYGLLAGRVIRWTKPKKPLETSRVTDTMKTNFSTLALPMALMLVVTVFLLEWFINWEGDLSLEDVNANATDTYNIFTAKSWPPSVSGILVGLLQLFIILAVGDTLGGSTAYVTVMSQWVVTKSLQERFPYMANTRCGIGNWWQVVYVLATVVGGLLSAFSSDSIGTEKGVSIAAAICGGMLLLIGARLASGCTSGHGLSGMALLFWLSIVAVPAMFAGGIGTAFAMDAAGALDSYVCYDSSPC